MKLDTIMLPLSIIFLVGTLFYVHEANKEKVMIDCSMAEISPDIPVQVKQLCRKARI